VQVVIAPDSFKGSLAAAEAAAALAAGWQAARPGDDVQTIPLADGGEGTLAVLAAAIPAARWRQAQVTGPAAQPGDRAQPVECPWLELPDGSAAVELAAASGLPLLSQLDPLGAHTTGLGQVIAAALEAGARQVTVALGGSASTDGGTGALAALGARFLDAGGRPLPAGGGALRDLAAVDLTGLRPPPPGGVSCLSDVRAPLLGPAGAAAVFGPQKGASPDQVALLDAGLARLAGLLGGDPAAPGAGAAGGTGYGLAAGWGALITPGAPRLARLAGLDQALARAGLVITGEGRYDQSSGTGKVAGAVFAAAAEAAVPAALVAGQVATSPPPGVPAVSLAGLAGGVPQALADPARYLRQAGQQLAGGWGAAQ